MLVLVSSFPQLLRRTDHHYWSPPRGVCKDFITPAFTPSDTFHPSTSHTSHVFARLRTPSHVFARLRTLRTTSHTSHNFAHFALHRTLRTTSHTFAILRIDIAPHRRLLRHHILLSNPTYSRRLTGDSQYFSTPENDTILGPPRTYSVQVNTSTTLRSLRCIPETLDTSPKPRYRL